MDSGIYTTNKEAVGSKDQWLKWLLVIGGVVLAGYLLSKLIAHLFQGKVKRPRIFISHSWKHDRDYWSLLEKMEIKEFRFYNHSIPYDDQLDADTAKQIETGLWKQMKWCSSVLVLAGSHASKYWVKKEVEIAQKLGKKIIAVRPWGNHNVPQYLRQGANEIIGFNSKTIIEKIKG
jgi:hypothetical protein